MGLPEKKRVKRKMALWQLLQWYIGKEDLNGFALFQSASENEKQE
ncbi:uncharacterized protein G2W53_011920 [Senna tora]|uniref:Uncharacterized protein n=1 Tax=Senna tora TaxID=362788 RepID=A0A834TYE8_9FABA|nr:uncharacterized protein G2W53_011920 [Senna tora]